MNLAALSQRLLADRRGVVAVVFALTLVPMLTAVGAAVDYSRATAVRADLQSAVDAAALAIGRAAIELGTTDNTEQGRQAFDAGFQPANGTTLVRFEVDQNT